MSDREVDRLRAELAALGREFANAEKANAKLRQELRELRASERRLAGQLEHIRSSPGWRALAPVRRLARRSSARRDA